MLVLRNRVPKKKLGIHIVLLMYTRLIHNIICVCVCIVCMRVYINGINSEVIEIQRSNEPSVLLIHCLRFYCDGIIIMRAIIE